MTTINSHIYVNPIEPQPLSLRVPSGLETHLDLLFLDQLGEPLNVDVLAQLELTGRSRGGGGMWFPVPSTDMVNGKARAVLPANTLDDPNGYQLRLYGTMQGQGMLLAAGVVAVTDARGMSSVPIDIIDTIDLTMQRDNDVLLNIAVWADETATVEFDVTTATISAAVYTSQGGDRLAPFAVSPIDNNEVQLTLAADIVNTLPAICWWSMIASGAGGVMTLAEGRVNVSGEIALPLPVTTDDWEYLKPATADEPLSGQIVHSSIAQGTLLISVLSQPGTDHVSLLADLEAGDRITIGATTWDVRFSNYNGLGWYEVTVTPIVQDAATGVVPVLFEPPA